MQATNYFQNGKSSSPGCPSAITNPGSAVFCRLPPAAATIVLALLLSACSTTPGPVEVRTVTVNVPISTPCVKASDIPRAPAKVGGLMNGNAAHDLDVVSASAIRLRAVLDITLALLGACTTH